MAVKLTERVVEALACPGASRDKLVSDTEQKSLGVRALANGSKSYFVQYFAAGRRSRVPLGSVDGISLAAARAAARGILGDKARGAGPAAERKAKAEAVKVAKLRTVARFQSSRPHPANRMPQRHARGSLMLRPVGHPAPILTSRHLGCVEAKIIVADVVVLA